MKNCSTTIWTLVIWLVFFQSVCFAEILHGVLPLDSLKEVKQKFPNAQFTRLKPAWVTEDEAFFRMSGSGFVGELYLDFSDERPSAKKSIAKLCSDSSDTPPESLCGIYSTLASQSDDEALSINWVRWVPPQAIPIQRYRSKYGEPTRIDFSKDTMEPEAHWDTIALDAGLSDDQKMVIKVETIFSRSERRQAYLRKYGFVPEFLKDSASPPSPSNDKSKPQAGKAKKQS